MKPRLHIKYEHDGATYTVKKSYLRLASIYRRFAGRHENLDFSKEALLECYLHESRGAVIKKYYGLESHKNNGYVFGKWQKDITITTWKEDIVNGYFCKSEFLTPLSKWWIEPALASLPFAVWFPFSDVYTNEVKNKVLENIQVKINQS